ncbi:cell envelope integrity protein TolA [Bacterioplanoides sp.]|uniref:cell envelope integrity protein TolA n=1 Tax=Bacterioplanoides sp. TaxID=2066072 RepID=UPI003AFFA40D
MSWKNPDSYGFATVIAVVIHLLVAGLFLIEWPDSHSQRLEPTPQHMMANVVQEENKAVKERQRKAEQAKKRKQREAKRRAEKERQRKLAAKRKQEKARQEKLKQQNLAKQKAQAEKKRKAEAKRVAEQKIAQQKAAAAQAERERLEQEQAMLEQLAQEEAQAELEAQKQAEEQEERSAKIKAEYAAQIKQLVTSNWSFNYGTNRDLEVLLRITLVPTGEVVQVQVIHASGDEAFDRLVEQAIYKASPLPVPKDIVEFERNFRNITMKFQPENAS